MANVSGSKHTNKQGQKAGTQSVAPGQGHNSNVNGSRHTTGTAKLESTGDRSAGGAARVSGSAHTNRGPVRPPKNNHPMAPGQAYHPNGEHEATNAPYEC
jgi:hypothetical protein